jgi:signal transduction histidine kinase
MITQILTVSGLQRGGLGLSPITFSLGTVARRALDALGVKAAGREIILDVDPTVEATGDQKRIEEVTYALIENALVFTSGRVAVSVTRGDEVACLTVSDEGPGLDSATLSRLLVNPFTQADSSSTRAVGGLGLSLYIAKQVLEASGGRLEVDTAAGRGATFTLVLPQPSA